MGIIWHCSAYTHHSVDSYRFISGQQILFKKPEYSGLSEYLGGCLVGDCIYRLFFHLLSLEFSFQFVEVRVQFLPFFHF